MSLRPRLSHSNCKALFGCTQHKAQVRLLTRAAQTPPDEPRRRFWFRKDSTSKEDAARKALEGMFKGQKDVLASFDSGSGGGGGGRRPAKRKGTGDGDEGDWRMPDWGQWREAAVRRLAGGSRAVLALLGFVAIFFILPLVPKVTGFSVRLIKTVLGLEGQSRSARGQAPQQLAPHQTADLGQWEAAVISKYGLSTDTAVNKYSTENEEVQ